MLKPESILDIPEETKVVAKKVFPKGNCPSYYCHPWPEILDSQRDEWFLTYEMAAMIGQR